MLKQQINSKEFVENIYNFFSLEQDKEQIYSCSNLSWNEYEFIGQLGKFFSLQFAIHEVEGS